MPLLAIKWQGHDSEFTLFHHSDISCHLLFWQQLHTFNWNFTYGNEGQVRIWSWVDEFLQRNTPLRNFQFLFIISLTVVHTELKFDLGICQRNAQVKFKFMLCPFLITIKKKNKISYCSLSPQRWYTFNSNLTYGYVKGLRRSNLNLVMVWWFWTKLSTILNVLLQYEVNLFHNNKVIAKILVI
jgi:hypothetical protein